VPRRKIYEVIEYLHVHTGKGSLSLQFKALQPLSE
jgi:hypothetical protein